MLFSIDDEFEDDFDDNFDDGLDENFDDNFGEEEDVSEAPKKKKKSPLFTIIIIVICVLGGGFVLMNSGILSTKPSSMPAETVASDLEEIVEEEVTETSQETIALMEQEDEILDVASEPEVSGTEFDMDIAEQEEQVQASQDFMEDLPVEQITEQPEEFDLFAGEEEATEEASDDLFSDNTSMTDVDDMFADAPAEQSDEVRIEDMQPEEFTFDEPEKESDLVMEEATPSEESVEQNPAKIDVETTNTETLSAPSEEVLSRLETVEDRVTGLESVSANMVPHEPAEVDPAVLEELRVEIARLQSEIKKLKEEKVKTASVSTPKATTTSKASVEVVEVKTESSAKSPVKWMIKSAQPGKALLSSNGKGVLSVKVGDVLSGVGTIKFIGINDQDLWEVRGTIASVLEPQ